MKQEEKKMIDEMSQEDLCYKFRFVQNDDLFKTTDTKAYFIQILKEKGGFTPETLKK